MKETNMEHFRGEIEAIVSKNHTFGISKVDGTINHCHMIGCADCTFIENGKVCDVEAIKWLMSEYKTKPVLTQREKHFVEFAQEGWIAREENGEIYFHEKKPYKGGCGWWSGTILCRLKYFGDIFPFITWEDEEPWSVADLRELKVKKHETYTTKDTCTATTEHNPSSVTTAHG